MLSLRILAIGVCLAFAMVPSLAADASKNLPLRVAQMTPNVCWEACSTPCGKTYEKCRANANPSSRQLSGCLTVLEACRNQCRDQCGFKK